MTVSPERIEEALKLSDELRRSIDATEDDALTVLAAALREAQAELRELGDEMSEQHDAAARELDKSAAALREAQAERDAARGGVEELAGHLRAASQQIREAQAENERLRGDLRRAVFLARNLFQMVPSQVWRDTGGDDGQGHWEGDYRAEKLREELDALAPADEAKR